MKLMLLNLLLLNLLGLLGGCLLVNCRRKGEIGVALLGGSIGKREARCSGKGIVAKGEGRVMGVKGGAQAGVGACVRLGQLLLVVVGLLGQRLPIHCASRGGVH